MGRLCIYSLASRDLFSTFRTHDDKSESEPQLPSGLSIGPGGKSCQGRYRARNPVGPLSDEPPDDRPAVPTAPTYPDAADRRVAIEECAPRTAAKPPPYIGVASTP